MITHNSTAHCEVQLPSFILCASLYVYTKHTVFLPKENVGDLLLKNLLSTLHTFPSHEILCFYVSLWLFRRLQDWIILYFTYSLLSNIQLVSIFIMISSAAVSSFTESYLPGAWCISAFIQFVSFIAQWSYETCTGLGYDLLFS